MITKKIEALLDSFVERNSEYLGSDFYSKLLSRCDNGKMTYEDVRTLLGKFNHLSVYFSNSNISDFRFDNFWICGRSVDVYIELYGEFFDIDVLHDLVDDLKDLSDEFDDGCYVTIDRVVEDEFGFSFSFDLDYENE